LLLGGGDYAYFDTDKRFGDLNATIDAWFDQWALPLSQAAVHDHVWQSRGRPWRRLRRLA
jgi:hypothetical protein